MTQYSYKDGEFTFPLCRPFSHYSLAQKQQVEYTELTLHEPTGQHGKYYRKVKQIYTSAEAALELKLASMFAASLQSTTGEGLQSLLERAEQAEKEPQKVVQKEKKDAQSILSCLEQTEKLDEFVEKFESLLAAKTEKAIAKCNGEDNFQKEHWVKLHPEDQINIAVEWFSFFVMPSLQRGQESKGQPTSASDQTEKSPIKQL